MLCTTKIIKSALGLFGNVDKSKIWLFKTNTP